MTPTAKAYREMGTEAFVGYLKRLQTIVAQIDSEIARETDKISLECLKDERRIYRQRIIDALQA